jgi:hypothetical protein
VTLAIRTKIVEAAGTQQEQKGLNSMKNGRWIFSLILIGILIAGLRIFALDPDRVERLYSDGFYALLASALNRVHGAFPFSFFEALIWLTLLILILVVGRAIYHWRKGRLTKGQSLGWLLLRLGTFAAFIYLWFLSFWGLNYYRVPLAEKIGIQGVQADEDQYRHTARWASSRISDLYSPSGMGDPWDAAQAALAALDRVLYNAGEHPNDAQPLLKQFLWNGPLDATQTFGITSPWTLEVHLSKRLFPEEIPFLAAHEAAHLKGYGSETAANLLAFEACLDSGNPLARFSAFYHTFFYLIAPLTEEERNILFESWPEGVRRLYQQIRERNEEMEGVISRVSHSLYDLYLKMNRVEGGIRSYSMVGNWVAILHAEEAEAALAEKEKRQGR